MPRRCSSWGLSSRSVIVLAGRHSAVGAPARRGHERAARAGHGTQVRHDGRMAEQQGVVALAVVGDGLGARRLQCSTPIPGFGVHLTRIIRN
jgi:hypothetical protein